MFTKAQSYSLTSMTHLFPLLLAAEAIHWNRAEAKRYTLYTSCIKHACRIFNVDWTELYSSVWQTKVYVIALTWIEMHFTQFFCILKVTLLESIWCQSLRRPAWLGSSSFITTAMALISASGNHWDWNCTGSTHPLLLFLEVPASINGYSIFDM